VQTQPHFLCLTGNFRKGVVRLALGLPYGSIHPFAIFFQILRKSFAARNLKCFDFYYFCVLSKPPSRQQIYFQNQCFTKEKQSITTRVNWPLSWECWAIQLHFETTFAHRARTRSAHKLWTVATFHSCFVWLAYSEFGSFMEWHASAAPWMRFRCNTWGLYMPYSFYLLSTAFLPVW